MIYGDNPNKINERQDALGLGYYSYSPNLAAILQAGNLYVYCGNNPIRYMDETGDFWEAIVIGFAVGLVGQYVSDVISNIQSGETGIDIFTPTSSGLDYFASGLGGAIASIPGLNLVGTMTVGAIGSITTSAIKGDINSVDDLTTSAFVGGAANGLGYGVAKIFATAKVIEIDSMPRTSRKIYLRDNIIDDAYYTSQKGANINLQTFANATLTENIKTVEKSFFVFKAGIYSTVSSTLFTLI